MGSYRDARNLSTKMVLVLTLVLAYEQSTISEITVTPEDGRATASQSLDWNHSLLSSSFCYGGNAIATEWIIAVASPSHNKREAKTHNLSAN
jgi:hypothetical protein